MAGALTADSVRRESQGSLFLHVAEFSDVVISDFWESGLTGVVTQWANVTTAPATQANVGISVRQSSGASGTFILIPGEDTQDVTLFVLSND